MKMRILHIIAFFFVLFISGSLQVRGDDSTDKKDEEWLEHESIIEGDEAARIVEDIENYGLDILNDKEIKRPDSAPNIEADLPEPDRKPEPLVATREQRWWWTLFKQHKLSMQDTTVVWPKFLKFCVDVYNWGDRTFNTYDPEYVQSTGKRWKVRLVSDNWLDTYDLNLPPMGGNGRIHSTMSSDVYANIGAYLQYMAVSVGSSYDFEKIFKKKEPSHKKYEFGFICALFNAELYYHENRGGVNIRSFDRVNEGKLMKEYFPGVNMYTLGFDAYYFFNNKKYSQGAAYNFAKYQMKSQGSFMLGLSITNQRLSFNFSELPDNIKDQHPDYDFKNYYFHYNSYAVLAGYGYNLVLAPKLLFNVTVMPSVGFSHYYEDSLEGNKYLLSLNIQGKLSLTYNLGNYFFGLFGNIKGHYYKQGQMSLFSSIENFSAYVGLRF
ncbi:MAG: DUF4421 domain-containing protein [Muribaculaceae bacterium]|nr:DUF4421 domain-containing protein [Muribaculaceae bacterium]